MESNSQHYYSNCYFALNHIYGSLEHNSVQKREKRTRNTKKGAIKVHMSRFDFETCLWGNSLITNESFKYFSQQQSSMMNGIVVWELTDSSGH